LKIGFIGAGKAGKALGLYFINHGLEIEGYYSKTFQSAKDAAQLTETKAFETIKSLAEDCEIIFITVPDHALTDIDGQISLLMNKGVINTKKCCIHISGAYPSDCLTRINAAGCLVGCMHPLQSFGEPKADALQLEKTYFSIEGTKKAVDIIKKILHKTGGRYSLISPEEKPLYHAGACVISNYLVTLIDSGMKYFEAAGMDRKMIFQAISPLIMSTLNNITKKDTKEALTGPIVRGDFNTLSVHLKAIEKELPSELELYKTLAIKTAEMIKGERMTEEQVKSLKDLMKGSNISGK
jgi:predicted short-subunit dehydrogenase-like oxidoreductase (DUF2520 family)